MYISIESVLLATGVIAALVSGAIFIVAVATVFMEVLSDLFVPKLDSFLRGVFKHKHCYKLTDVKMKTQSQYRCKCGDIIYKFDKR